MIFTSDRHFPRNDDRTIGRMVTLLAALMASDRDLTNSELWLSDNQ